MQKSPLKEPRRTQVVSGRTPQANENIPCTVRQWLIGVAGPVSPTALDDIPFEIKLVRLCRFVVPVQLRRLRSGEGRERGTMIRSHFLPLCHPNRSTEISESN